MLPIISPKQLKELSAEKLIILDVRTGKDSYQNYLNQHLKNARFVDLEKHWLLPVSSLEDVENELTNESSSVIDVRDSYRYKGESEPIDLVAGHIPGAINIPFSENLDENGNFLKPEILKEKYQKLLENKPEKLIIHCGSGVTACHTILALAYAGFEIPNLYVGSWSEWSRREGKEIAKEI